MVNDNCNVLRLCASVRKHFCQALSSPGSSPHCQLAVFIIDCYPQGRGLRALSPDYEAMLGGLLSLALESFTYFWWIIPLLIICLLNVCHSFSYCMALHCCFFALILDLLFSLSSGVGDIMDFWLLVCLPNFGPHGCLILPFRLLPLTQNNRIKKFIIGKDQKCWI